MDNPEDMEWEETDSSLKNSVPDNQINNGDDHNTSNDAESIEEKSKLRGRARPYTKIKDFEDYDSAKQYMEKEREDYTYRYTRPSHILGDKMW